MQRGKQVPTRFDALKLADRGERIRGEVVATALPRLADRVIRPAGTDDSRIRWSVSGGRDAQGRRALSLDLEGQLFVLCQRCMRPLTLPIEQQTGLLLARDETELARLDTDEQEVVLAAVPLDAVTLVEDELLLSLPFAPCHAKDECEAAVATVAPTASSPFARLAHLKSGSRPRN